MEKRVMLYKGDHSPVYAYRGHLIQVIDPKGWKPLWEVTNRLTGKMVLRVAGLKLACSYLDKRLDAR